MIRLLADGERDRLTKGGLLFDAPVQRKARAARVQRAEPVAAVPAVAPSAPAASGRSGVLAGLDADQARAAAMVKGPLAVIAGPGSGKTRMLTHRIAHLVRECGVAAASCLAVTFTRRATAELRARLIALLSDEGAEVAVHSFHSLGLAMLRADGAALCLAYDVRIADEASARRRWPPRSISAPPRRAAHHGGVGAQAQRRDRRGRAAGGARRARPAGVAGAGLRSRVMGSRCG